MYVVLSLLNEGVRNIKGVLALQPMDTQLSRLADMFEKVYECCGSTVIQHVSKSILDKPPHLVIHCNYAKHLVPRLEALKRGKNDPQIFATGNR